jgi:hypothetical protein
MIINVHSQYLLIYFSYSASKRRHLITIHSHRCNWRRRSSKCSVGIRSNNIEKSINPINIFSSKNNILPRALCHWWYGFLPRSWNLSLFTVLWESTNSLIVSLQKVKKMLYMSLHFLHVIYIFWFISILETSWMSSRRVVVRQSSSLKKATFISNQSRVYIIFHYTSTRSRSYP